jgi:hypothetical protein
MYDLLIQIFLLVYFVANLFLTYLGFLDFYRLKLKSTLVFSVAMWLLYASYTLNLLDLISSEVSIILTLTGVFPGLILSLVIGLREDKYSKIVYARLKQLSWRDRILRRLPEDFWEKPIPEDVIIPSIPWQRIIAATTILMAGLMSTLFSIFPVFFLFAIIGFGVPVLFLTGCALVTAAILVYLGFGKVGGVIGLVAAVIQFFTSGFFGVIFGLLGVIDAGLALIDAMKRERV